VGYDIVDLTDNVYSIPFSVSGLNDDGKDVDYALGVAVGSHMSSICDQTKTPFQARYHLGTRIITISDYFSSPISAGCLEKFYPYLPASAVSMSMHC
jgi:hypothetical protein